MMLYEFVCTYVLFMFVCMLIVWRNLMLLCVEYMRVCMYKYIHVLVIKTQLQ